MNHPAQNNFGQESAVKPRLYVITPVSRPANLEKMRASVDGLQSWFDIEWIKIESGPEVDRWGCHKRDIALHQVLNKPSGWIYHLDDDNLIHPEFGEAVSRAIGSDSNARLFIISGVENHPPLFGPIDSVDKVQVGKIDTAQFVVHSSVAAKTRWLNRWEGDGLYIVGIINSGVAVSFIARRCALYNALRRPTAT